MKVASIALLAASLVSFSAYAANNIQADDTISNPPTAQTPIEKSVDQALTPTDSNPVTGPTTASNDKNASSNSDQITPDTATGDDDY